MFLIIVDLMCDLGQRAIMMRREDVKCVCERERLRNCNFSCYKSRKVRYKPNIGFLGQAEEELVAALLLKQ